MNRQDQKLVLTKSEAAELLGVSVDTIDRLILAGLLPALRISAGRKRGRVGIRRTALDAFLADREAEGV